jgi:PAS domain S-box-containing protein
MVATMSNKPDANNFLDILPLEQVLRTMPSGLFLVDLKQVVVYWNEEAERITGFSAAEALGQHCSFLEGIECGQGCGLYQESVTKPILGASCTIKTKAGKQIVVTKNVDYLRKDGEIVGGIESFIDISEQKELERKLRDHGKQLEIAVNQRTRELDQERRRLSSLLEAMTDFAYIVSDDTRIQYMNPAMTAVFGDMSGKLCYTALYGRDQVCLDCPLSRTLRGEIIREERSNANTKRIYEILHTPLYSLDGTLQKLAVCRDITERKAAEQALRDANADLAAFAHTVSHDLRTPLTPIIGFAEFLREEYSDKLDDRAIEILFDIENQGHKLLQMMEDLLVLAKVGRLKTPAEPHLVGPVIEEIIEDLDEQIRKKQAQIQVALLPEANIPATLLTQLFTNLIVNALHYGCPPKGTIEIGGERHDNLLRFYVRDHGPGLPEKDRKRVFEPFSRGKQKEGPGSGIGLAIVEKIARLYNGRAWVEETPGGGCTFIVELAEAEE